MHAIGIDIGGTKIAGAVVDELGAIVRSERVPTPSGDVAKLEDAVVAMITSLAADEEVAAVGVAAAGFIDAAQSTVYYAPNIAWRN
ncbi:MAG TPA: ROK family protein, partial [Microbacterium sp.]|nr:ROK family protein [Microbacterium sp.]